MLFLQGGFEPNVQCTGKLQVAFQVFMSTNAKFITVTIRSYTCTVYINDKTVGPVESLPQFRRHQSIAEVILS